MTEQNKDTSNYSESFRSLRIKTGLTPKEFGEVLGLRERTVRRLEAGMSRLPNDIEFYEQLSRFPNMNTSDINALLGSEGAPKWLVKTVGRSLIDIPSNTLFPDQE